MNEVKPAQSQQVKAIKSNRILVGQDRLVEGVHSWIEIDYE